MGIYTKKQLANALKMSKSSFWRVIQPYYNKFSVAFKTQKMVSVMDAKKLFTLLGYDDEFVENTLKNIK